MIINITIIHNLSVSYSKNSNMITKGLPHYAAGIIVKGFGRGSKELGCPTGKLFYDFIFIYYFFYFLQIFYYFCVMYDMKEILFMNKLSRSCTLTLSTMITNDMPLMCNLLFLTLYNSGCVNKCLIFCLFSYFTFHFSKNKFYI